NSRESLILEMVSFHSANNVTLTLHNKVTVSIKFVTYNVKDIAGDQYTYTAWPGPTIAPGSVVLTNFLIGSSCSSCTLSGTAFTFAFGSSYTVTIVTARSNQPSFTGTSEYAQTRAFTLE